MSDTKHHILQHTIHNVLTSMGLILQTKKQLDEKQTAEMSELLFLLTALIEHTDFLLEGKIDFLNENIQMSELLEIICVIYADISVHTCEATIDDSIDALILTIDKMHFANALKYVLRYFFQASRRLAFSFESSKGQMIIQHDTDYTHVRDKSLLDCLSCGVDSREKVLIYLGCDILATMKIDVTFQSQKIIIQFPKGLLIGDYAS